VAIDPKNLPKDPEILQQIVVDLTRQLDKSQRLLQQLLTTRGGTQSEQLSPDQLRLFAQQTGIELPHSAEPEKKTANEESGDDGPPAAGSGGSAGKKRGRQALPGHLKRERLVHDLAEQDKHCAECGHDLRHIGEEVSERYEWLRSSHSFAAIHSGADAGDSGCLPEVRLRLHGENRRQAGAAH
jgi:transposase